MIFAGFSINQQKRDRLSFESLSLFIEPMKMPFLTRKGKYAMDVSVIPE